MRKMSQLQRVEGLVSLSFFGSYGWEWPGPAQIASYQRTYGCPAGQPGKLAVDFAAPAPGLASGECRPGHRCNKARSLPMRAATVIASWSWPCTGEALGLSQNGAVFCPLDSGPASGRFYPSLQNRVPALGVTRRATAIAPDKIPGISQLIRLHDDGAILGGLNLVAPAFNLGLRIIPGGIIAVILPGFGNRPPAKSATVRGGGQLSGPFQLRTALYFGLPALHQGALGGLFFFFARRGGGRC